jgi:phage shock protein B
VSDLIGVALIVFLAVPAPLIIVMHFITKWKQSREISGGDERMLEDLWGLSQKLEERLESLETILDNESPEWRRKQ